MMKRILVAGISVVFILIISLSVLAFTKSQQFVDATTPQDGPQKRVGISIDQFAPKEPRFKKLIPPRIVLGINVLTVSFGEFNEPPPIVTSVSEFKKQQEQKKEEPAKPQPPEEKRNIHNAVLSVKSASVPDQRVSVQAGSIVSLAIIIVGLLIYGSMRSMLRKSAA